VVTTAAWIAGAEYSNERGIPLAAFACCRVRAALQRRYREEWGYAKHMCPYSTADDGGREPCAALPTGAAGLDMLDLCAKVKEAVADLPVDLRNLIEQLFWEGRSQWEVSRKLGICQTAVSKRKRIALKLLRQNPVLREAA
jgi:DNA-directed RNA polymerase specialized sigma subunit